jgi:hypothetical protein
VVAGQDRRDRAGRWQRVPIRVRAREHHPQFAPTPGRGGLPQSNDRRFDVRWRAGGTGLRASRLRGQPGNALPPIPGQPLLARGRTDRNRPTQGADIRPRHTRVFTKLEPTTHQRTLLEGHGGAPFGGTIRSPRVSTISSNTCPPSLQSVQQNGRGYEFSRLQPGL